MIWPVLWLLVSWHVLQTALDMHAGPASAALHLLLWEQLAAVSWQPSAAF